MCACDKAINILRMIVGFIARDVVSLKIAAHRNTHVVIALTRALRFSTTSDSRALAAGLVHMFTIAQ